jgi:outer membrane protein OmpA-like peptidoglycan-associated protein
MNTTSLGLVTALVLFQSVASYAAGIYQMDYRYSFSDMARDSARRQTFVICDDVCAAIPPLAPAPRFPALSVRISQDIAAKKSPEKAPDRGSRDTPPNKDASDREHAADARITVLFGLDSSALSDAERSRLSSFVKGLDAETKGGDLFVTGYTCDLGSKAHNDVLAIERAEAVETYLRKAGLHVMWVTGTGKCCYATKDPGKRYLNRRVEVTISKREATK